jgi:hypothetical protein
MTDETYSISSNKRPGRFIFQLPLKGGRLLEEIGYI